MRILLCIVWLMACMTARGATNYAASAAKADVQTAIDACNQGDTVMIPDGNVTWTSPGISTTKRIRIVGTNYLGTTINWGASSTALTVAIGNDYSVEIANIKWLPVSGIGGAGRMLTFDGTGTKPFLLHHCYFNCLNFENDRAIKVNTAGGVIWSCIVTSNVTDGTLHSHGSGSIWLTHQSPINWTNATTMGTADTGYTNNLYFEDCTFYKMINSWLDADNSSRCVIRSNYIQDACGTHHGITSGVGARHSEWYNNVFAFRTYPINGSGITHCNINQYIWTRAGTFLMCSNSFEDITSGDFGAKPEIRITAESLGRPGNFIPCESAYPGSHWTGFGANGSAQISDPVYLWDNTGTGVLGYGTDDLCNGGTLETEDFLLSGRDWFQDAGARPGWTPAPYPHPLRTADSGGGASPSAGVAVRVGPGKSKSK